MSTQQQHQLDREQTPSAANCRPTTAIARIPPANVGRLKTIQHDQTLALAAAPLAFELESCPLDAIKISIRFECAHQTAALNETQMDFLITTTNNVRQLANQHNTESAATTFDTITKSIKTLLANLANGEHSKQPAQPQQTASNMDTNNNNDTENQLPNFEIASKSKSPTGTDKQLDESSALAWPHSFIVLLESLSKKQQLQQQKPPSNGTDCAPGASSPQRSISSLAIDEHDFELLCGLQHCAGMSPALEMSKLEPETDLAKPEQFPQKSTQQNSPTNWLMCFDSTNTLAGSSALIDSDRFAHNRPANETDIEPTEIDENQLQTIAQCDRAESPIKPSPPNDRRHELKRCKTLPVRFDRITWLQRLVETTETGTETENASTGVTTKTETNDEQLITGTLNLGATDSIEAKQDFDDEEELDEESESETNAGGTNDDNNNNHAELAKRAESASSECGSSNRLPAASQRHQQADVALGGKQERLGGKKDEDGKYSMLQFALHNFREALDKYSGLLKQKHAQAGDTSTLRGSLKLIESLRNAAPAGDSSAPGGALDSQASNAANKSRSASSSDWSWRELAEMVKFTRRPLKRSLLLLPQTDDLERRALDCFQAIMQYMGDLASSQSPLSGSSRAPSSEVECVYLILINCHNYPLLRDEIYCQLMKQTTNNRQEPGSQLDSCLRGWRLFSIVAAYFDCSPKLKPYLVRYLEQAAYDKRRAYHSVALLCLQNLRKTFRYQGRKNVPSVEEIAATSAGRNSKRQIYRLPGGTERVINTKSSTVVEDIISEICSQMLGIQEPNEMLEFSLYCIADGDLYTMPLARDEYILDITTELVKNHQRYFLIFCRSIWHFPLRLDQQLYIELTFNQIAPDYLEGLLLVLPPCFLSARSQWRRRKQQQQQHHGAKTLDSAASESSASSSQATAAAAAATRQRGKLVRELARIAALLHRASGTDYMPHRDEIKYLLPKPIVASLRHQQQRLGKLSPDCAPLSSGASSASSSAASGAASLSALDDERPGSAVPPTPADAAPAPNEQQWTELVQAHWREMSAFDTLDAKAQFLDIVRHWPLFGSSFFAIKLIQRDLIQPKEFILALNKLGIHMLDTLSHETCHRYPFSEVLSTRKVRSEDGALFLDLKCGNLMKRTIIRVQTDQAHEIGRLIRQYIDIELLQNTNTQAAANGASQNESAAKLNGESKDEAPQVAH